MKVICIDLGEQEGKNIEVFPSKIKAESSHLPFPPCGISIMRVYDRAVTFATQKIRRRMWSHMSRQLRYLKPICVTSKAIPGNLWETKLISWIYRKAKGGWNCFCKVTRKLFLFNRFDALSQQSSLKSFSFVPSFKKSSWKQSWRHAELAGIWN